MLRVWLVLIKARLFIMKAEILSLIHAAVCCFCEHMVQYIRSCVFFVDPSNTSSTTARGKQGSAQEAWVSWVWWVLVRPLTTLQLGRFQLITWGVWMGGEGGWCFRRKRKESGFLNVHPNSQENCSSSSNTTVVSPLKIYKIHYPHWHNIP